MAAARAGADVVYPVVFFDALRVKMRDEGTVRSKACLSRARPLARRQSRHSGHLDRGQTEGAKFWLKVFTDLKTRGCHDILIAVTDGLKGMSEALAAVYPATTLQTCLVHLIRHSLDFATWKVRKDLAAALRTIYTAPAAGLRSRRSTSSRKGRGGTAIRPLWPVGATPGPIRDPVFCVSARRAQGALHHQRPGECARAAPQDSQDPRPLPDRRGPLPTTPRPN